MNVTAFPQIADALRKGLETVDLLVPLGAAGGPAAANVAAVIGALSEMGQAALDAVEAGLIVATSDDEQVVRSVLSELQQKNDALASRIAGG